MSGASAEMVFIRNILRSKIDQLPKMRHEFLTGKQLCNPFMIDAQAEVHRSGFCGGGLSLQPTKKLRNAVV